MRRLLALLLILAPASGFPEIEQTGTGVDLLVRGTSDGDELRGDVVTYRLSSLVDTIWPWGRLEDPTITSNTLKRFYLVRIPDMTTTQAETLMESWVLRYVVTEAPSITAVKEITISAAEPSVSRVGEIDRAVIDDFMVSEGATFTRTGRNQVKYIVEKTKDIRRLEDELNARFSDILATRKRRLGTEFMGALEEDGKTTDVTSAVIITRLTLRTNE